MVSRDPDVQLEVYPLQVYFSRCARMCRMPPVSCTFFERLVTHEVSLEACELLLMRHLLVSTDELLNSSAHTWCQPVSVGVTTGAGAVVVVVDPAVRDTSSMSIAELRETSQPSTLRSIDAP